MGTHSLNEMINVLKSINRTLDGIRVELRTNNELIKEVRDGRQRENKESD